MADAWVVNTTGLPDGYVPPSASLSPPTDAGDRLQQAVDIVARHVIASGADERSGWWDMYPEIGEDDWAAVGKRAEDLAPFPDKAQYAAAYDFLAGRAEGAEP